MADLQQLEDSIVGLSLLDAAALVKKLEERLGVSAAAAAPVTVAQAAAPSAAAPAAGAPLDMKSAEALMQKNGCAACHSVDKKIVGPAYVDVAAKYRGDKDAMAKLVQKVKAGGSGVWGDVPMPPNAQIVPEADIKALVSWILTLKK